MLRTHVLVLIGSAAALLVACGGNVVFVEDGDDGIGSGAGGPGSGPGAGPGSGTASGQGNGCQLLCATHPECLDVGDCESTCEQIYVAGCEKEADALVTCLAHAFDANCSVGFDCVAEIEAYGSCVSVNPPPPPPDPECTTNGCDGGGNQCGCQGDCFGGQLNVRCQNVPDEGVICDCSFDGQDGHQDASCQQGQLDCSLETSCCVTALFGGEDF